MDRLYSAATTALRGTCGACPLRYRWSCCANAQTAGAELNSPYLLVCCQAVECLYFTPLTNASIAAFSRLSRCCVVFENGGLSPVYPPLFGRAPRFLGRGCPIFFATSKLTWNGAHVTHSSLPLPVVRMGTRTATGGFFCVSSLFRWQLLLGGPLWP